MPFPQELLDAHRNFKIVMEEGAKCIRRMWTLRQEAYVVEQSEIGNRHLSTKTWRSHADQIEQGVREFVRLLVKNFGSVWNSSSLFVSDNKAMLLPGFVKELDEPVIEQVQEVSE